MNAAEARAKTNEVFESKIAKKLEKLKHDEEELKKEAEILYNLILNEIEQAALRGEGYVEFDQNNVNIINGTPMYTDVPYFDYITKEEHNTKGFIAASKLTELGFKVTLYWNVDNTGDTTDKSYFKIRYWW